MHKTYPYEFASAYTEENYVKSLDDMVVQQLDMEYCRTSAERSKAVYDHLLFGQIPPHRLKPLKVRDNLAAYAATHGVREQDLRTWYEKHTSEHEKTLIRIRAQAKSTSRAADWIVALKPLLKWRMFLIVLDNVDRIERDRQRVCFQFSIDCFNDGQGLVKPIITIRQENAHGVWQDAWSVAVDRISIDGRNVDPLPVFMELTDIMGPVIWKRHTWCEQRLPEFHEQWRRVNMTLRLLSDTQGMKRICDLANGSIRLGVEYYYRFMMYLLKEVKGQALQELLESPVKDSLMHSCLLAWIAQAGDILDKQAMNLCKLYEKCRDQNFASFGCDLNYMILANLDKADAVTTIGQVIYDFSLLKISQEVVYNHLWELFSMKREDYGHVVEMWDGDRKLTRESLAPSTQVVITPRGRCLLREASVTFTFISMLLEQHRDLKEEQWRGDSYFALANYGIHARNNVRFIAEVAFLHAVELCRIATTINRRDWYSRYQAKFCIKGALQVTRVIDANKAYLNELRERVQGKLKEELDICWHALVELGKAYEADVNRMLPRSQCVYDYRRMAALLLENREAGIGPLAKLDKQVGDLLTRE